MVLYNISQVGNSTGFFNFVQNINTNILNDMLGLLILFIVFGVTLMSFLGLGYDFKKGIISTSYILMLVSLLLYIADLTQVIVLVVCALVFALSLGISFIDT